MSDAMYINRSEYKYLLPLKDACELQRKLNLLLQRDAHCLQDPYRIRSLYFDTPDNRDYHENLAGLECRRKIRLRTYDPGADTCKLELKEKKGEFSHKTSLFLSRADAERLMQGERQVLLQNCPSPDALRIYTEMETHAYRPSALIEYERMAYLYPSFDVRITFDAEIRSSESCQDLFVKAPVYTPLLLNGVILEVKFNEHLPRFLTGVFRSFRLNRRAFSKYASGRITTT